ncbi:MAG: PAS domain S-box protein [Nitrospirae bacterium]|nr:PAS domain S-box protein [Nitrospirota bacterium]
MKDELTLSNALLDIIPGIALVLKKQSREIVFCNEVAQQMGAVVGKTCFETICKSDDACPFCKAPDLWESGERQQVEAEYLGRFWEGIWLPYNDDFYLHYLFDITDRKWTEDKLRKSEATARTLLNLPNAAGFLLDRNGICLDTNETLARRLSRNRMEIIGKLIWDFFPKDVSESRKAHFEQVLMGKKQVRFVDERQGMWNEAVVTPILDDNGEVEVVTVFGFDITEHKRAEDQLRNNLYLYSTILLTAMDGFLLMDLQGRILDVNEAYCLMSCYSKQELLSMGIADLEVIETPEEVAAHSQEIIGKGKGRFESQHRRKDGTIFDVEVSVQYQPIDSGRFVSFLRDITERKKIQTELNDANALNKSIIDNSTDCIKVLDLDGRLKYMSVGGQHLLGITDISKYINMRYDKFWEGDDNKKAIDAIEQALQGRHGSFIGFCPTAVGTPKWWDVNISPIKNDSGAVEKLLATSRDITERRNVELELEKHRNSLESLVSERTEQLELLNKKLNIEITERKQAEKALEETNSALKVLLKRRELDKIEFEEKVSSNIKLLLTPHLEKAKKATSKHDINVHLNILESNIKELVSSFALKLSSTQVGLTPKEIAVAGMVREGYQDKNIAKALKLSIYTVKVHRKNLRKKLGITGKNVNLTSFLSSISE